MTASSGTLTAASCGSVVAAKHVQGEEQRLGSERWLSRDEEHDDEG